MLIETDNYYEIIGFTNLQIPQYIKTAHRLLEYEASLGDELEMFLRKNPSLWGIAHIPINLALLCYIWKDIAKEASITSQRYVSMTELYQLIVTKLSIRYVSSYLISERDLRKYRKHGKEVEKLYPKAQAALNALSEIAFTEFVKGHYIIAYNDIQSILNNHQPALSEAANEIKVLGGEDIDELDLNLVMPHLVKTGFLKTFAASETAGESYYFLHLTFQEYFTALYISNWLKGEVHPTFPLPEPKYAEGTLFAPLPDNADTALHFIRRLIMTPRYERVFWFLAGLLKSDAENIQTLFDVIVNAPIQSVYSFEQLEFDPYPVYMLLRCFEESQLPNIRQYEELLTAFRKFAIRIFLYTNDHPKTGKYFKDYAHYLRLSPQVKIKAGITQRIQERSEQAWYSQQDYAKTALLELEDEIKIHAALKLASETKNNDTKFQLFFIAGLSAITQEEIKTLQEYLFKLLDNPISKETQLIAGIVLGQFGWADDKVITILRSYYSHTKLIKSMRKVALETLLLYIKKPEEKLLLENCYLLYDEDTINRHSAVEYLRKLNANTPQIVDSLFLALKDDNRDVQRSAAEALGKLGANTPQVTDGLLLALNDGNEDAKMSAAVALGSLGANTSQVVDRLFLALKDGNRGVQRSAAEALGNLGANTPQVVDRLLLALKDGNQYVQWSAAEALGNLGANTPQVTDGLLLTLKGGDKVARMRAAVALGNLGANTPQVVDGLLLALKDDGEYARVNAAEVLGKLDASTPQVLGGLLLALKDRNEYVRMSAARNLGKLDVNTPQVVDGLLLALKDDNKEVRGNAAVALGKLGANRPQFTVGLLLALKDDDEARTSAAVALGDLGAITPQVADDLRLALKDDDEYADAWMIAAVVALRILGANTQQMVDGLLLASRDDDMDVCLRAAEALGKMNSNTPQMVKNDEVGTKSVANVSNAQQNQEHSSSMVCNRNTLFVVASIGVAIVGIGATNYFANNGR